MSENFNCFWPQCEHRLHCGPWFFCHVDSIHKFTLLLAFCHLLLTHLVGGHVVVGTGVYRCHFYMYTCFFCCSWVQCEHNLKLSNQFFLPCRWWHPQLDHFWPLYPYLLEGYLEVVQWEQDHLILTHTKHNFHFSFL